MGVSGISFAVPPFVLLPLSHALLILLFLFPSSFISLVTWRGRGGAGIAGHGAAWALQAIRDMSGEDLPIFVFANWRGFSGGMKVTFFLLLHHLSFLCFSFYLLCTPRFSYTLSSSLSLLLLARTQYPNLPCLARSGRVVAGQDMFDQVLKFGSFIVDALRAHTQPIFVYVPKQGMLRGGAWVRACACAPFFCV